MLFPPRLRDVPDQELEAIIREAIAACSTDRSRLSMMLADAGAQYLVDRLRLAGCIVSVADEASRSGR